MSGIDKVAEFYSCLDRFCYLAENYAPQSLPGFIIGAMSNIIDFVKSNEQIKQEINKAYKYFEDGGDYPINVRND